MVFIFTDRIFLSKYAADKAKSVAFDMENVFANSFGSCYNIIMLNVDALIDFYGEKKRIVVAIDKGITLILGASGAYKSVLLKVIGGVEVIEDGTVEIDGENIEELSPKERNMLLISKETMPPIKKIGKALMQPLLLRKVAKKEAKRIAIETAERFGLDFDGLIANDKRKFFEARMSLRSARATMFDEPYHFFNEDVSEMIRSGKSDYVIVTSSDGEDARKLCPDNLIVLKYGEVLQSGTYDEVRSSPINKYVDLLVNM